MRTFWRCRWHKVLQSLNSNGQKQGCLCRRAEIFLNTFRILRARCGLCLFAQTRRQLDTSGSARRTRGGCHSVAVWRQRSSSPRHKSESNKSIILSFPQGFCVLYRRLLTTGHAASGPANTRKSRRLGDVCRWHSDCSARGVGRPVPHHILGGRRNE
jgi:hypothetical protein